MGTTLALPKTGIEAGIFGGFHFSPWPTFALGCTGFASREGRQRPQNRIWRHPSMEAMKGAQIPARARTAFCGAFGTARHAEATAIANGRGSGRRCVADQGQPLRFLCPPRRGHQISTSRWLQTTSGKRIMDGVVLVQRIVGCEGARDDDAAHPSGVPAGLDRPGGRRGLGTDVLSAHGHAKGTGTRWHWKTTEFKVRQSAEQGNW